MHAQPRSTIKRLRIIAGPNGSGKSSLFDELKKNIPVYDFINADETKIQLEKNKFIELPFPVTKEQLKNYIHTTTFSDSVKSIFDSSGIKCVGNKIFFDTASISIYGALPDSSVDTVSKASQ